MPPFSGWSGELKYPSGIFREGNCPRRKKEVWRFKSFRSTRADGPLPIKGSDPTERSCNYTSPRNLDYRFNNSIKFKTIDGELSNISGPRFMSPGLEELTPPYSLVLCFQDLVDVRASIGSGNDLLVWE